MIPVEDSTESCDFGIQIVYWKKENATLNPPSPRVKGKKTREKPGRLVSSAEAYKVRYSCPRSVVLVEKGPLLSNHIGSSKLATSSPTVGPDSALSSQIVFDKGHPVRLFIGQYPCLDRKRVLLKSLDNLGSVGLSS